MHFLLRELGIDGDDLPSEDLQWLSNFYFWARYPGEEFVVVKDSEYNRAYSIAEKTRISVLSKIEEKERKKEKEKEKEKVASGLTVPQALSDLLAKASIS